MCALLAKRLLLNDFVELRGLDVKNFVAGKPNKGCAAVISFVPNLPHSEENGSALLGPGLSF